MLFPETHWEMGEREGMRTLSLSVLCVFLCCVLRVGAGEAPSKEAKNGAAPQNGSAEAKGKYVAKGEAKSADAKTDIAKKAEGNKPEATTSDIAISADNSLVHEPSKDAGGYVIVQNGASTTDEASVVLTEEEFAALIAENPDIVSGELVGEYMPAEDAFVFSNGTVVSSVVSADASDTSYWPCSWRDFSISKDYVNGKGFVIYADAGYKWVFLRKMGFTAGGVDMRRNLTIGGGAAAIGFGYSLGDDVPIALEVDIGIGPSLAFSNRKTVGARHVDMRQKLSIYSLDASIDYDIKKQGKFTPFIGINTGLALMSDRGRVNVFDGGALTATGRYDKKHRVTLMGGLRLGAKLQVHERVMLSAVAEYNYLGDNPAQRFTLSNGSHAATKRIKAHELNLKVGVKMHF